jgi:hypothetical protein
MLSIDELAGLLTKCESLIEKYTEEKNNIIAIEEKDNNSLLEQLDKEIEPVIYQLEELRIFLSAKSVILDLQINYLQQTDVELQQTDVEQINYKRDFLRNIINIGFGYTDLVCARDYVYIGNKSIDIRTNAQKKLEIKRFFKNFIQTDIVTLNKAWHMLKDVPAKQVALELKYTEKQDNENKLEKFFDIKTKIVTAYQDLCYRLSQQTDGKKQQQYNDKSILLQNSLLTSSQPMLLTKSIIASNAEINDTSILIMIASCIETIKDLQILMDEFSYDGEVQAAIKDIIEYPKRVLNPDNLTYNKGAIDAEIAAGLFPDGHEFMAQFRIKALTSKHVKPDYRNWLLGEYNTRVWNDSPVDTVTEQRKLINIVVKDILCATEEIARQRLNKYIKDNLSIEDGRFILNHFTSFKNSYITSKQELKEQYKSVLQNRTKGVKYA